MSLDIFLADIDRLRSGVTGEPLTGMRMRMRYWRSWGPENSITEVLTARPANSSLKIALYSMQATESTRSSWEFFVEPLTEVEVLPQRSECTVVGVLAPGRAVIVRVGDFEMMSVSPLSPPLRGKKFGKP